MDLLKMHLNSATQRLEARVSSSTGKAGATIAAKATTSKSKRSQRGAQGYEQETDDNGQSQKKQKANYLGTFANIDCFFLQCISASPFHSFTLTHTHTFKYAHSFSEEAHGTRSKATGSDHEDPVDDGKEAEEQEANEAADEIYAQQGEDHREGRSESVV